jgi:hypothetical protein
MSEGCPECGRVSCGRETVPECVAAQFQPYPTKHELKDRIRELEAKLAAMFDIEESWNKCNIDEQECLNRILEVLHFKEQSHE